MIKKNKKNASENWREPTSPSQLPSRPLTSESQVSLPDDSTNVGSPLALVSHLQGFPKEVHWL